MKSLHTALSVFCTFADVGREIGVSEMCTLTGLRKSQVSKIMKVFREHGLLQQNPVTRKYSPSLRAYSIGSEFVNRHPLSHVALPVLRQLTESSGHSATLSVIDDLRTVHLLAVEGPLFMDARWRAGRSIVFHVSASARVLIAFRDKEDVETIIERDGMPRMTERTITDPATLFTVLARIRERGFDVSRDEGVNGLGALAVPVMGATDDVVASLGLLFPSHLVPEAQDAGLLSRMHDSARQISGRLGATIYPFGDGATNAGGKEAS